ncbi:MAG: hypothetical protein ABIS28_21160 [Caldimonas sp.]
MRASASAARALSCLARCPRKAAVKTIALLLVVPLAGCMSILRVNSEDPQVIVDKRVVGTQVGAFFQRYGPVRVREESSDGSMQFTWEGGRNHVPAGPRGPEESLCRLRVSTDKAGRILSAPIIRDGQGEKRVSRCVELFD